MRWWCRPILALVLTNCLSLANLTSSTVTETKFLSRRVRGLIFPDKAALLLTAALTKLILGGRPSGLQYSLEFDMYVPLPDSIHGWEPTILHRHLKPKAKMPMLPMKPKPRWDWYGYRMGSGSEPYYPYAGYNPPTSYKTNRMSSKNFYKTPWHVDENPSTSYKTNRISTNNFYKTPWHLGKPSATWNTDNDDEVYDSWLHVPTWKLNRDYRERRDIYDQFEAMGHFFQLDLRSCIKRAMCELRARVNQQHDDGFLMEDLMRIILTIPENVIDDPKYKHRLDIKDCERFYAVTCPYRVLDFLTQRSKK
ncbi:uncharacterized protein [Drosophila tropicalis]|uniref:uncharacterized protein n=1 Tax=Drosophila tropicalis TaxID=46794 RepID=UPI0035ABB62B